MQLPFEPPWLDIIGTLAELNCSSVECLTCDGFQTLELCNERIRASAHVATDPSFIQIALPKLSKEKKMSLILNHMTHDSSP